jgi:4-amino-4-deoxy-L-arabinose transferase-like glycosyltransferase
MVMSEPESPASEPSKPVLPKGSPSEAPDSDRTSDPKPEAADTPEEHSHDDSDDVVAKKDTDDSHDEEKSEELAAKADTKSEDENEEDEVVLVPRGNPLRWARGGITTFSGALGAFLLMAHDGQLRWGVPIGFIFVAIAAWGVMDLLGSFDDADTDAAGNSLVLSENTLRTLAGPLLKLAGSTVLYLGSVEGAQSGVQFGLAEGTSQIVWGVIVTAAFFTLVAMVYGLGVALGPWAKDEFGLEVPFYKRYGFWVIAAGTLLYLPTLGSYSLWDPWETHYGEVAREMLSRDDWISTWWAQDGWFFSKPVLDFWIQAIAMATLGTHYHPDQMLIGAGGLANAHPEWVVRTPNFLLTIFAMYVLYKGVAKAFGRRAGLLGALVLATMPDWFFLAHQTMTDMPFVATMTAAMGFFLIGVNTDEDKIAHIYKLKLGKNTYGLTAWHLTFGAVLLCLVPQVLYLLSRNFDLITHNGFGFAAHYDKFSSGSGGGNCGLPGNEACKAADPAILSHAIPTHPDTFSMQIARFFGAFEPTLQAILWGGIGGLLLYTNWGERRVRRLCYHAAWLMAAISTMAKGPAGFGLPMLCGFAYICANKRFGELLRMEMLSGLFIILAVAMPWYVAMYVRHGAQFTDRLIFHDMFNRAFEHVHDTNEGDDTSFRFYIWQLGYATFPWIGFAPLGLVYWLRRRDAGDGQRGDVSVFLGMWFIFAFVLFSLMGTKFHHYLLPAIPPVAMLIGIVLDDILSSSERSRLKAQDVPVSEGYRSVPPDERNDEEEKRASHEGVMVGASALAGAMVILLAGRDLAITPDGADQPGAIRLLQLFTYNYRRAWPDNLDFSKALWFFTIGAAILSVLFAARAIRRYAVFGFVAFAFAWAIWGVDDYMMKTAQHWGQHEIITQYYRMRASPDEPLVAYQMNWKGENFYTGNHVPAFVSSGAPFVAWLKAEKEKGHHVMYFITEHQRVNGLKSEVQPKVFAEVTDKYLDNKFTLCRAEL